VAIRAVWSPDDCPLDLLPWLAWGLSLDNWSTDWPESIKRERVRKAIAIARRKGTAIGALRRRQLRRLGGDPRMVAERAEGPAAHLQPDPQPRQRGRARLGRHAHARRGAGRGPPPPQRPAGGLRLDAGR
jgi:hypothetical protein